jgi:CRISPR system Cascade subunit CasC
LPDVVLVRLREARPVSFAGAFEKPVSTADGGYLKNACRALDEHIGEIERAYGAVAAESWLLRVGEATQALARHGREVSLEELIENVGAAVANRLEPRG